MIVAKFRDDGVDSYRAYHVRDELSNFHVLVSGRSKTDTLGTVGGGAGVNTDVALDGIENVAKWAKVVRAMLNEGVMEITTETVQSRLMQPVHG